MLCLLIALLKHLLPKKWGVRQSAEFVNQMISVERIVGYQDLEQEAPAETMSNDDDKRMLLDSQWPSSGEIVFDRMSLSYGTMEQAVLRNITCTIRGGEKIGIVGRTGK